MKGRPSRASTKWKCRQGTIELFRLHMNYPLKLNFIFHHFCGRITISKGQMWHTVIEDEALLKTFMQMILHNDFLSRPKPSQGSHAHSFKYRRKTSGHLDIESQQLFIRPSRSSISQKRLLGDELPGAKELADSYGAFRVPTLCPPTPKP